MKMTKEATRMIKKKFGSNLVSIVLFGSQARGLATEDSDVDLIVVAKKLPKDYKQWDELTLDIRLELLKKTERSFDILLMEPEDAKNNFKSFSPVFSTLILGCRILYDKEEFFKKNFKRFLLQSQEQDFQYGEGGKIWQLDEMAQSIASLL